MISIYSNEKANFLDLITIEDIHVLKSLTVLHKYAQVCIY